jgi:hypothetical protein
VYYSGSERRSRFAEQKNVAYFSHALCQPVHHKHKSVSAVDNSHMVFHGHNVTSSIGIAHKIPVDEFFGVQRWFGGAFSPCW